MPFASAGIVWPFGIGAGPRAVHVGVVKVVVVKSWGIAGTLRGRCVDRTGAVVDVSASALCGGLAILAVGLRGFCALVNTGTARRAAAMKVNKAVRKKPRGNTCALLGSGHSDFM